MRKTNQHTKSMQQISLGSSRNSRKSLGSGTLNPLTDRGEAYIGKQQPKLARLNQAREFMMGLDKDKSGYISGVNYNKVLRIFGLASGAGTIQEGKVDYARALANLAE